jgi:hypothetical protein
MKLEDTQSGIICIMAETFLIRGFWGPRAEGMPWSRWSRA